MENKIFNIWVYIAIAALFAWWLKSSFDRKKHYDGARALGFGEYWLDQMTNQEIADFYSYIYDYTQKGKMPRIGSSLDIRLVELSKKFPAILKYN